MKTVVEARNIAMFSRMLDKESSQRVGIVPAVPLFSTEEIIPV